MEGVPDCSSKHVKFDNHKESTSRRQPFASWVIFDSEATGLKRRTRITELCMLAVLTDELKSTGRQIPRVVNKLQLCFNPESAIEAEASRITGLYNDALEQMATFTDQAALITGFLSSLPQPVCIIAHNGHRFDFPLLQSEFRKAQHSAEARGVYCADSLQAFRVLDGLPPVPEWVLQREKEEKQRKALASTANSSSTQKRSGDGSDNAAVVGSTSQTARDEDDESSTVSPSKRQLSHIDNPADDSPSVSKLSKQETGSAFGSQSSISDDDLVKAYDAAIAPADAEHVEGRVGPVPEPVVGVSQQSAQETTPVRDLRWTNSGPCPRHVVKKPPPVSVDVEQRQRVVRRLFGEDPNSSSNAKPLQATSESNSFQPNEPELPNTAESEPANTISSQGSLPDEQIVQLAQQAELEAVTSLPPCSSGAGEPALLADASGAVTVTTRGTRATGYPLPSAAGGESVQRTLGRSPLPAGKGRSLPSSTQIQGSEVTSKRVAQPPGKACPSRPLSSSATPTASYKLGEVYRRQFGQYPAMSHTAEGDCLSLLRIMMSKRSDFITFAEDHAVRFDTVDPMY